eukprot:COSAG01_NODE_1027_length_12036_cov_4.718857_9_plen_721_part_00
MDAAVSEPSQEESALSEYERHAVSMASGKRILQQRTGLTHSAIETLASCVHAQWKVASPSWLPAWVLLWCQQRVSGQVDAMLTEILSESFASSTGDSNQYLLAIASLIDTFPCSCINVACILPIFQKCDVAVSAAQHNNTSDHVKQAFVRLLSKCLLHSTDAAHRATNWKVLAVGDCAVSEVLQHLQALGPAEATQVQDHVRRPLDDFLSFIDKCAHPFEYYPAAEQLQLLARTGDLFATTSLQCSEACFLQLCKFLQLATSQRRTDKAHVQLLKLVTSIVTHIVKHNSYYRDHVVQQVLAASVDDFIFCGLHIELLDLIWVLPNRRANAACLVCSMVDSADSVSMDKLLSLLGKTVLCMCDLLREKLMDALDSTPDTQEDGNPEVDDDAFDHMHRDEQRRNDVAMVDGAITDTLQFGFLSRFMPLLQTIINDRLLREASLGSAAHHRLHTAAVITLGKFMVVSRTCADEFCTKVVNIMLDTQVHASSRHAALAVVADMHVTIPTHQSLITQHGCTVLAELFADAVVGRAALHQVLRLCTIRVAQTDVHLGLLAGCLRNQSDVERIVAFFRVYMRNSTNTKRNKDAHARFIHKIYCALPADLSVEAVQDATTLLIQEFCSSSADASCAFATLLVKRLTEKVDAAAAALLAVHTRHSNNDAIVALMAKIQARQIAALVGNTDEAAAVLHTLVNTITSFSGKQCADSMYHLQSISVLLRSLD